MFHAFLHENIKISDISTFVQGHLEAFAWDWGKIEEGRWWGGRAHPQGKWKFDVEAQKHQNRIEILFFRLQKPNLSWKNLLKQEEEAKREAEEEDDLDDLDLDDDDL